MKIKEKEKQKIIPQNKNNNKIELLFFIALNLLVVPFSTWQTFLGYEKDVAGNPILAFIVAAISGVLFFAMNFGIRSSRILGEKHFLKVIMYIVPLAISFPGNFNAFYSNQMKDSLLRNEVTDYKLTLRKTKESALEQIEKSVKIKEFKEGYNSRYETLRIEVKGKNDMGWGKLSQKKWRELCDYIKKEGGTIDIKSIEKFTKKDIRKFAKASELAEGQKKSIIKSKENKISSKVSDIKNKFKETNDFIESKLNRSKPIYSSVMLDKIVETENLIRSKTESFFNNNNVFSHTALKASDQNEIGTIKHSFNSAFVKRDYPTAMMFSSFLSLIIDFSALLYILVFIAYNKTAKTKKEGRIANNGSRKI